MPSHHRAQQCALQFASGIDGLAGGTVTADSRDHSTQSTRILPSLGIFCKEVATEEKSREEEDK